MNPTLTLLPSPAAVCEVSSRFHGSSCEEDDYQLELLAAQIVSFALPSFDLTHNLVSLGLRGITARIA